VKTDDEGELTIRVFTHNKKIMVDFGTEVAWFGMDKQQAIAFAKTILSHANAIYTGTIQ
jgi:hypothetical protein